jgi:hypothetical protein
MVPHSVGCNTGCSGSAGVEEERGGCHSDTALVITLNFGIRASIISEISSHKPRCEPRRQTRRSCHPITVTSKKWSRDIRPCSKRWFCNHHQNFVSLLLMMCVSSNDQSLRSNVGKFLYGSTRLGSIIERCARIVGTKGDESDSNSDFSSGFVKVSIRGLSSVVPWAQTGLVSTFYCGIRCPLTPYPTAFIRSCHRLAQ